MSFTFVYLLCFSLSFLFRFVSFIFLCVLSTIRRYIFSTERKNKCINVTEVPYVKSQNEHFIYIQHDRHISFIIFLIFYSFFCCCCFDFVIFTYFIVLPVNYSLLDRNVRWEYFARSIMVRENVLMFNLFLMNWWILCDNDNYHLVDFSIFICSLN